MIIDTLRESYCSSDSVHRESGLSTGELNRL